MLQKLALQRGLVNCVPVHSSGNILPNIDKPLGTLYMDQIVTDEVFYITPEGT